MKDPARARGIRRETVLVMGSICFSLALLEAFLRLLSPSPYIGIRTTPPQDTFFQHDRLLGWRGVPHARGPFRGVDFDVTVTLDMEGHRNDTPSLIENKRNILILGDSYGWGWGVDNEDVFHHQMMAMDEMLNIYNLSAPGYGTDQEYLLLGDFLEGNTDNEYEGTILLFYLNDFQDTAAKVRYSYPKPMFVLSPDGALSLVNVPVPRRPPSPPRTEYAIDVEAPTWMNSSQAYNFLTFKIPQLWSGGDDSRSSASRSREQAAFDVTLALLGRLAELNRSKDMFFHVVILMTHNVDRDAWQWKPLERFLSEREIPFSEFRSRKLPNTDLWLDGHLSRYGHRKLAEHIAGALAGPR